MRQITRILLMVCLAAVIALACGSDTAADGPPATEPLVITPSVTVTVQVDQGRSPISPYVYGSNQDDGTDVWTLRRLGGNRLTGYNWENNDSNAGSDYIHSSDLFLIANEGLPTSDAAIPARVVTYFHDQSVAMGAQSIVTLQMAGYASADAAGTVQT